MDNPAIALVYFSATNVTREYATVMAQALREQNCGVTLFNVTPYAARQERLPVEDHDVWVFGFPVYADFAPSVINQWLPTLEGGGKRCAQFLTYGGRTSGYAHFHTKLLLEGAGFQVLFSAEFLGRHSFNVGGWRMLPDRPDQEDLALARDYATLALERFRQESPPLFRLQKPFGYGRNVASLERPAEERTRWWPNPSRTAESCSMCRQCETECPTQAFDAGSGKSDPILCIDCMRCVTVCPEGLIQLDERLTVPYQRFLDYCHLTDEMMQAKRSKIITEAWQAAA